MVAAETWTSTWTAIGVLAQAAILLFAAIFAGWQVREARSLRREQMRPYVIAYLRRHEIVESLLEIVVENIGARPAKNVHFDVSPAFVSTLDQPGKELVKDWTVFSEGVAQIAPGQRLTTIADSSLGRYADGSELPTTYKVVATYRNDHWREELVDESVIDMNSFRGMRFTSHRGIHDVSRQLESIAKSLDSWNESYGHGLRVFTMSLEELESKREEEWNHHFQTRSGTGMSAEPAERNGEDGRGDEPKVVA